MNSNRLWYERTHQVKKEPMLDSQKAYDILCLAIIRQAIKDNCDLSFFTSDWYDALTTNLPMFRNGRMIFEQVKANREAGYKTGMQIANLREEE